MNDDNNIIKVLCLLIHEESGLPYGFCTGHGMFYSMSDCTSVIVI